MEEFQLSLGQSGMLTSFFAITGLLLAFPAGIIIQRLGPKFAGLIALGSLVAGSTMGIFSTSINILLFSRVIEGIGMGLIAVVGPAVIAMWFPRKNQGIPMGIWSTWASMGALLMYNLAPMIANTGGWQAVWWFGSIFALVGFILLAFFMKVPAKSMNPVAEQNSDSTNGSISTQSGMKETLMNVNLWLLAFQFACYVCVLSAFATFLPTFLNAELDFDLADAAFIASIPTFVILGAAPFSGWLSDKIGSRKKIYTIAFACLAVILIFPFHLSPEQFPYFMPLMGIVAAGVPTAVFASVPEVTKNPKMIGIAVAMLITGQNLGLFIGPIYFGLVIDATSWLTAGYTLVPICLLGTLAGWFVKVR